MELNLEAMLQEASMQIGGMTNRAMVLAAQLRVAEIKIKTLEDENAKLKEGKEEKVVPIKG